MPQDDLVSETAGCDVFFCVVLSFCNLTSGTEILVTRKAFSETLVVLTSLNVVELTNGLEVMSETAVVTTLVLGIFSTLVLVLVAVAEPTLGKLDLLDTTFPSGELAVLILSVLCAIVTFID